MPKPIVKKPRVLNIRDKESVGIYIGRPTHFGNPFVIGKDGIREEVIAKYREWIYLPEQLELRKLVQKVLKGKDLLCYCKPEACHGDVLLELANAKTHK